MALILTCLLAACGPRYVTDYDLFPPKGAAGKQCVTECVVQKERCEKECYRDALQCENYNNNGGIYGGIGSGRGGYWDTRIGSAFPSTYNSCPVGNCEQTCRAQQLQCHETCGGKVVPRAPRCVSGCSTR